MQLETGKSSQGLVGTFTGIVRQEGYVCSGHAIRNTLTSRVAPVSEDCTEAWFLRY